jgi:hypothetical protein
MTSAKARARRAAIRATTGLKSGAITRYERTMPSNLG